MMLSNDLWGFRRMFLHVTSRSFSRSTLCLCIRRLSKPNAHRPNRFFPAPLITFGGHHTYLYELSAVSPEFLLFFTQPESLPSQITGHDACNDAYAKRNRTVGDQGIPVIDKPQKMKNGNDCKNDACDPVKQFLSHRLFLRM